MRHHPWTHADTTSGLPDLDWRRMFVGWVLCKATPVARVPVSPNSQRSFILVIVGPTENEFGSHILAKSGVDVYISKRHVLVGCTKYRIHIYIWLLYQIFGFTY